jgi:HD superfamily phosphohydrolase
MLAVHGGELMVEEKGIYSIEKFLVARRLMYWQVYLHKTVLSAEKMLVKILERARELLHKDEEISCSTPVLDFFLKGGFLKDSGEHPDAAGEQLDKFCLLDDSDVMSTIKNWAFHPDKILSILCRGLIDRRLLKVRLQATPFAENTVMELKRKVSRELSVSVEEAGYVVFTGQTTNTTYDPSDEKINILFKDGMVKDISEVDNALIQQTLSSPVKKFYICYLNSTIQS